MITKIKTSVINAYNSVLNVLKIRKYQISIGTCLVLSIVSLFGILKISGLLITGYLIYELANKSVKK